MSEEDQGAFAPLADIGAEGDLDGTIDTFEDTATARTGKIEAELRFVGARA
jgi:hypothetical protein